MSLSTQAVPAWQGVNHIALATADLDATINFYQDVLGLRLLANLPPNDLHGRHCVLWPGGSGLGLHFFELADAQIFTHPDALSALRFVPGALQHISLTLPNAEAGQAMRERLSALGIQTTEIMEQKPIYNFGLLDNNGIQVEVAWFKPGVTPPIIDVIQ
jgi:catechol 2,3-dioxygenase-like lactoylglutathione lyase family enzyme